MSAGPDVRMLGPIASGGMGAVSLALRATSDGGTVPVAVKRLHAHHADDPENVASFVDEARIASRIEHPNVTRIFDVEMLGEELVIVMDYVEGAPLSHLLRALRGSSACLPIEVACRIMREALTGLDAAHELRDISGAPLGIVHRDVSPQNVLVGCDGITRVTDFGIAVASGRLASTKNELQVKGKLHYLSPEQIYRRGVDRRADVFAAGNVLWECLTGRKLFAAGTEGETLAMILREPIAPPSSLRMQVPIELDEICLKALERDPERRFQSAAEFAEALSAFATATEEAVSKVVEDLARDLLSERRTLLTKGRALSVASADVSRAAPTHADIPNSTIRKRLRHGAVAAALVVGIFGGACGMKLSSPALSQPLASTPAATTALVESTSPLTAPPAAPAAAPPNGGDELEIVIATPNTSPAEPLARMASKPAAAKPRAPKASAANARRTSKPFMPSDP